MATRFDYKPPFGLDIRVKPPADTGGAPICSYPTCRAIATVHAPASPENPDEKIWLCVAHAREHNRNWNFFAHMNEDEARAFQESAHTGHRPTWRFGSDTRAARAARASGPRREGFHDPHGAFGARGGGPGPEEKPRRKTSRVQEKALAVFDLDADASADDIRDRYVALVKRFHPDANGGDRGDERRLRRVLDAYRALKAAGYC